MESESRSNLKAMEEEKGRRIRGTDRNGCGTASDNKNKHIHENIIPSTHHTIRLISNCSLN